MYTVNNLSDGFYKELKPDGFKKTISNNLAGLLNNKEKEEISEYFRKNSNKSLYLIAVNKDDCSDDCSEKSISKTAFTLNHEEYHTSKQLQGKNTTEEDEHLQYFDVKSHYTPSTNEIINKKEYQNSLANKEVQNIIKVAKEFGIIINYK